MRLTKNKSVSRKNLVLCHFSSHVVVSSDTLQLLVYMYYYYYFINLAINSLNAELNPICHLLALLGAHHILHVSRIRVNMRLLRYLMH